MKKYIKNVIFFLTFLHKNRYNKNIDAMQMHMNKNNLLQIYV